MERSHSNVVFVKSSSQKLDIHFISVTKGEKPLKGNVCKPFKGSVCEIKFIKTEIPTLLHFAK